MIDSNNTSNTYDKSTLDAKFDAITSKLTELTLRLSLCVTNTAHTTDINRAVTNALGELPRHYITREELAIELNKYTTKTSMLNYITKDGLSNTLNVNTNTVDIYNNGKIGLKYENDTLSLCANAPYAAPVLSLALTPSIVEYGKTYSATISASVTNPLNLKTLFISGGSLSGVNITTNKTASDTASSTQSTAYTVTCTDTNNAVTNKSISTQIGRKILYGKVEPTAGTFNSYSGTSVIASTNPSTVSINQNGNTYGWIATPWKLGSIADATTTYIGGWMANNTGELAQYKTFESPYADKITYYVYRTSEYGTGNNTWILTNK